MVNISNHFSKLVFVLFFSVQEKWKLILMEAYLIYCALNNPSPVQCVSVQDVQFLMGVICVHNCVLVSQIPLTK